MPHIQLLDDSLVDQIAAGEVVERPASVVKELIENAIDAKASAIVVEIVEGGRERIRITDDGVGMSPEDAALCIKRHATSKIRQFDDLHALRTMGFRGEALPSIASVSRFRILTRPRDAISGTEVRIAGAGSPTLAPVGCPPGTVVEVDELFFNVPARRKFLKARQTETHHIKDICLRVALAHPHLRIKLLVDGRTSREYLPAASRFERAQQIFSDFELRHIAETRDEIRVEAALAPATAARTGMRRLFLFVNRRPIEDRALARNVALAFGDALAPGRYPTGVVWLELPPQEVDVNAHPQKTEVRFASARRVYDGVLRIISAGLQTQNWAEGVTGTAAEAVQPKSPASLQRSGDYWSTRLGMGPLAAPGAGGISRERPSPDSPAEGGMLDGPTAGTGALAEALSQSGAVAEAVTRYEPVPIADAGPTESSSLTVGVLRNGMLVSQTETGLSVIDPRRIAARQIETEVGKHPSRRLIFPARVEVEPAVVDRFQSQPHELGGLGFELTVVGPTTLAVHAVPNLPATSGCGAAYLAAVDPETLLRAALDAPKPAEAIAVAAARSTPTFGPDGLQRLVMAAAAETRESATVHFDFTEIERRFNR